MRCDKKRRLRWFMRMLRPYQYLFFIGLCLSIVGAFSSLALPFIAGSLADPDQMRFVTSHKSVIFLGVGLILLVYAVQGLAVYILGKVGANVIKNLGNKFIRHTLFLPVYQLGELSSGDLASRLTNDISELAKIITTTIPQIIINGIIILGTGLILLSINMKLTVIALVVIFGVGLMLLPLNKQVEVLYNAHKTYLGEMSGMYTQRILNNRLVKSYLGEPQELVAFNQQFNRLYVNFTDIIFTMSIFNTLMSGILIFIVLGFLLYTSWQVNNGVMLFSEMVTFILYIVQVIAPISDMFTNCLEFFETKGTLKRVTDIFKIETEKQDQALMRTDITDGEIVFEDMSFRYGDASGVLNKLNLTIPSNQLVAIVGPSGSGKSTIFSLLLKFFEEYEGEIFIDGHELRTIPQNDLRRQIACVSQESNFFKGTIRYNLTYGKNKDASDEAIEHALRQSGAFNFISELSGQLDMNIGESGMELSEGQKQRLNIARAIISNPKVLLLDEATANLDTVTEKHITQTLSELKRTITTIVIAHRLITVIEADMIIVLEKDGTVEHIGTHQELLLTSKTYQMMYSEVLV